jgi:hypothetical protein
MAFTGAIAADAAIGGEVAADVGLGAAVGEGALAADAGLAGADLFGAGALGADAGLFGGADALAAGAGADLFAGAPLAADAAAGLSGGAEIGAGGIEAAPFLADAGTATSVGAADAAAGTFGFGGAELAGASGAADLGGATGATANTFGSLGTVGEALPSQGLAGAGPAASAAPATGAAATPTSVLNQGTDLLDVSSGGIQDALQTGAQTGEAQGLAGGTNVADLGGNVPQSDTFSQRFIGDMAPFDEQPAAVADAVPAPTPGAFDSAFQPNPQMMPDAGAPANMPPTPADSGEPWIGSGQDAVNAPTSGFASATSPSGGAAPAAAASKGGGGFNWMQGGMLALGAAPLALTLARGEAQLPPQAGQLAANNQNLSNFANQELASVSANQLTTGQAAQIAQQTQTLQNQWRQALFNQGVQDPSKDSRWPQIQAQIAQTETAASQAMIQTNLNAALGASGLASQNLIALANMQIQQDTAFSNAIAEATKALGIVAAMTAMSGARA